MAPHRRIAALLQRLRLPAQRPRSSARRRFVAGLSALPALLLLPRPSRAAPAPIPEIEAVTGGTPAKSGRVKLDVPRLAEEVNSIAVTVTVESPMSASDYVKGIHLFAPKNPRRALAHFHLGPRAGRAEIGTRIRLAESQNVIAVAELSDGTFWSDSAPVEVTVSACYDGS